MEALKHLFLKIERPASLSTYFRVKRLRLGGFNSSDQSVTSFPHGDYCYTVSAGLGFNEEIANRAIALARKEIDEQNRAGHSGQIDDLDEHPNELTADIQNEFRLAHAIEHLAIIDMYKRVAFLPQTNMGNSGIYDLAKSFIINGTKRKSNMVGFCFRKGLMNPDQELQSVENAAAQVRQLKQ